MKANPFFELYVGDRISAREYVTIFSPLLIPHIEPLFLPGNIVVTGIQGCGKSMLLSLLKPGIRIEYEKAGAEFPVPRRLRKFICGSVNLSHSNAIDFGYRSYVDKEVLKTEILFGDFLNYLLVQSIIECIQEYLECTDKLRNEVGINFNQTQFDQLAREISSHEVWDGWIGECASFSELHRRLKDRIQKYRRFTHRKDPDLAPELYDTATSIGVPLIEVAKMLYSSGAIDSDTHVFADIDQYEELGNISSRNTPGQFVDYRAVINKALSSRSPEISYRIGTRGHSWRRHGKIHGTSGNLEMMRHYKYIDLDDILKKDENDSARVDSVFRNFAKDVFERRLKFSGFEFPTANTNSAMEAIYQSNFSPSEKVNQHYGLRNPSQYLRLDPSWSEKTKSALVALSTRDLFSSKMGEVWVRQKGDSENLAVPDEKLPWNRVSNRWWKKERAHMLAIQIAALSKQKSLWGGAYEIIELSGGSILSFIAINQFIWSAWLQQRNRVDVLPTELPKIGLNIQSVAILKASNAWLEIITEQTGRSAERSRFIQKAATFLVRKLMKDAALSYPGASGFSLSKEELDNAPQVKEFLEELADYGNMVMLNHTTKEKNRLPRKKFYFHPIFCPSLGLPYIRTKEPFYAKIIDVATWIHESGYDVGVSKDTTPSQGEMI